MQDPDWMGTFPSSVRWGIHGDNIYFNYNPEKNPTDSLYRISLNNSKEILKVTAKEEQELIPSNGDFNDSRSQKIFTEDGNKSGSRV